MKQYAPREPRIEPTRASAPQPTSSKSRIARAKGPGQTLEAATRAFFEPRFGHDFGAVRVHTDRAADESARRMGASAYVEGEHIFWAHGRYRPETLAGHHLLGHELAHVIQQRLAGTPSREISTSGDTDEVQAEKAASAIRFRTPGFMSKPWGDGNTTLRAILSVNKVLSAAGLRLLVTTELSNWGPDYEGVTVDPEDWRQGRTSNEIGDAVKKELDSNDDSILLHSRIPATADATPAILTDIKSRNFTFDPTVRGALGSIAPKAPFAELTTISNPPTASEIAQARVWLRANMLKIGPNGSAQVAMGIFRLAQQAGDAEVRAFIAEIRATKVKTPDGEIPMASWMIVNPEWGMFTRFFETWMTKKPFPRTK